MSKVLKIGPDYSLHFNYNEITGVQEMTKDKYDIRDIHKMNDSYNEIEEIIIYELKKPLDNIPPSVNKITINKCSDVLRSQNRIPFDCELIIKESRITDINILDKFKDEDYDDINIISLRNELTSIPEQIGKCKNLTHLYLNENIITSIPDFIGNLINLKILMLYMNKITTIPDCIGNLINLETLSLSNNNISIIPDSIGNLTNLNVLYLDGNKLTILPDSIGNLINLKYLMINRNKLSTVPETMCNLINLTEFKLYENKIKTIPNCLKKLNNLKVIRIKKY